MTDQTVTVSPDARAARRQTLLDRWTEILTDHAIPEDHARGYARELRAAMDDLGFRLPASLEDAPPRSVVPDTDGPGYAEFQREKAALAARRRT